MSLGVFLLGWLLAAGVLAMLALAWAGVAAVAEPGVSWPARGVVGLTAALAVWPGLLARQMVAGYGLWLLAGVTLILGGAGVCLWRLARSDELRLPAGVALAASGHLWLVLAVAVFWQGV